MIVLAALLGLVMGAVIGGLGGGGGVLTVPALVYLLGQSAQAATTASVVIVGVTAAAGVIARARSGGVDWRTGVMFGLVGVPAAWLGTAVNHRVDQPTLMLAFAGLTLIAALAMLLDARGKRAAGPAAPDPTGAEPDTDDGAAPARASDGAGGGTVLAADRRSRAGPLLAFAAEVAGGGAAVGFLTGFLGVGGGFLVVPVLVIMLRMPMTLAIGTSLLIIALNSASSMVSRLGALHLDWRIVVPFTLAAVVGTLLGKRISDRLSGRTLGIAFAWLLVGVGLFVGIQNLLAL
ncbi:sulfite exporter TauE/SafE family protein [Pseudonocardia sp. NPDC049154]|uniref:sulfite exporter TauE/SafE family protein n=1 Tax=Pseudonocardia sp. NPDC049154 TaxID=3155501 RepID=UPI003409D416